MRRTASSRSVGLLASTALLLTTLTAGGTATAAPAAPAASPTSSAPYCGIAWGSKPVITGTWRRGTVNDVRAGRHACFDRIVIDMTGPAPGFQVQYRKRVRADGSGKVVPVAGGGKLQVTVHKRAVRRVAVPKVAGFDTLRQVRWVGSFEGYTTLAVGVRARLPMRAFTLRDPATRTSRLVIDIAHRW